MTAHRATLRAGARAARSAGAKAAPRPQPIRQTAAPHEPLAFAGPFEKEAARQLADSQLRLNLARASALIARKTAAASSELPDWQQLRRAGSSIRLQALHHLDEHLLALEASVAHAGGVVHWARDGEEACAIVTRIVEAHDVREVIKAKSITTEEIGLNEALSAAGISAFETDLAQLIVQLAKERPSHILVPALHKSAAQIRDLLIRTLPQADQSLSEDPHQLVQLVRAHLRPRLLHTKVAITGVNFAAADTGTLALVESEGNGRMCLTMPEVLICVMGIEKVIPRFHDLEVLLQLLPRSSTAERMNPYTSLWSGLTDAEGPSEMHLILLDNGRTNVLADEVGRQALACIKCSACLNVCPVYSRVGGHAYGSVHPGPIGAILTPMLTGMQGTSSLPYASTLCGACYQVCPVKIDIPRVLLHLRSVDVEGKRGATGASRLGERAAMRGTALLFSHRRAYELSQRLGRLLLRLIPRGRHLRRPALIARWSTSRDLPVPPHQSFRDWWQSQSGDQSRQERSRR